MKLLYLAIFSLLLSFTLLLQTSCVGGFLGNCITVEGKKTTTETRKAGTFSGIELSIPADVYISQGDAQEIKITAKRKVLEQIVTFVEEGVLIIEYDTCIRNPDSIKIYITAENFNSLSIVGSGDINTLYPIKSDELELKIDGSGDFDIAAEAGSIRIKINGSGDVRLSGTADALKVGINGSGDVKALKTIAGSCKVKINGSGDCAVHAEKSLDIRVNGSGDVKYKGPAEVTTSINGSGSVKKL